MKVKKVGQLNDRNEITLAGKTRKDVLLVLTNNNFDQYVPTTVLLLPLIIGQGPSARMHTIECPVANEVLMAQHTTPANLASDGSFRFEGEYFFGAFIFRNQIFSVEAEHLDDASEEEAILLIKRQAYSDDSRLRRLRQEVQTIERVVGDVGIKRIAIPEAVKLLVYTRDAGKCVRCGSAEKLHFDHIIPVSKGGGNSENNIQVLCDYCNLQKSDRIAF
ncbi:MAG TPA: HNH endonuclease signature motif containing protein [Pyrinomonadaceae bacterium]|nr:HNH endonuclease signature motif containing protein [Pyrinomonadaceae bacterium]